VRFSYALWGGRFFVEREEEARQLVERFRLDMIWPLGGTQEVRDFSKKFPHLRSPFYGDSIFVKDERWRSFAHILDISNTISHWHTKPEWKYFRDKGIRPTSGAGTTRLLTCS
jgi:hypothetical protein